MARICDRCGEKPAGDSHARWVMHAALPSVPLAGKPHKVQVTLAVTAPYEDIDTCPNCAIEAITQAFEQLMGLYGGICANCYDRGKVGQECARCKVCSYIPTYVRTHGQEDNEKADDRARQTDDGATVEKEGVRQGDGEETRRRWGSGRAGRRAGADRTPDR